MASTAEERALIRDAARSFLTDESGSAQVRRWMATELGYDRPLWGRVAGELGWPAVPVPEAQGGLGLGWADVALLMEEMGRSLFCSPFLATIGLAATALRLSGNEALQERFLSGLAQGEATAALVVSAWTARDPAARVPIRFRRDGTDFRLDGTCRHVIDGHSADLLVVPAVGEGGLALFVLSGNAAGVSRALLPTLDQTRKLAELGFADVAVPADGLLSEPGDGASLLQRVLDYAVVALAAEQAGGAQSCLDLTVAYIKERVQFGRAIGSFQAIKHRCAHLMIQVRSALAAAAEAAEAADRDDPEFPLLASMAKAYCSEAYFACAGEAIQLHGGVGFTWEYDPHLHLKRARAGLSLLGEPDWHRARIASGLGI